MNDLEPPPQINEFNWIWQKWLSAIHDWIRFESSTTTVTATPYTASEYQVILVDDDTVGGAVTVNLPPSASANRPYHIKKLGTTGSVTIDGDGAETIDGAATLVLSTQYHSRFVVSDGSNWHVI